MSGARRFRQLEFFEPGPVLCEWCGKPGAVFCSPAHRRTYERKHGRLARGASSGGVAWAAEPTAARPATSPAMCASSSSADLSPPDEGAR